MNQEKFAQYDNFKDSELSWLGLVPSHWNLTRVKNLTKTQTGTTPQSGSNEYYENGTEFWVRTTDLNNNHLYESEYKVTKLAIKHYGLRQIPADSVLLAMYGGMGTIGKNSFLKNEVTINQSVCAILPNKKKFNSVYFWYYIQYFRPHWEMFADSARKDPNINQEAIKRLWLILPPLVEQAAIASYLDIKTAQIDRKIDLLSQKTTRYDKLRQSLIKETVTRGLDKAVTLKDSGIEWIGEIPMQWKISRVYEAVKVINGYPFDSNLFDSSEGLPLIRIRDINKSEVNTYFKGDLVVSALITSVDVLIGMDGDFNVGHWNGEGKALLNQRVCCIRGNNKLLTKLIEYMLPFPLQLINNLTNATTVKHLSSNQVGKISVALPCNKNEQQAIVTYLDEKTAHIDKIVATITRQIDKLKELRKTLINDVVTGKIKVVQERETA